MITSAEKTLSEAQKAAVLDDSARILVAAGAGSGKTRLLVAYFVRALVDEGTAPERLIAVTFTRKAAAELTARIRERLEELRRPDLALALDEATVGTIHSLCAGLLREHPLEAGVDPGFSILEAEAAALVTREVRDEIWYQAVESATEAELDILGSHTTLLREEIVPLYERLRCAGVEHPQVTIPPGRPAEESRARLAETVREALDTGAAAPRRTNSLATDLARLERCLSWIEGAEAGLDPEDQLRLSEGCFPTRLTASMEPYFGPARAALTSYRRSLAEQQLRPVVAVMNDLLARFDHSYTAYKRERSLLDFTDLELNARALLREEGGATVVTSGSGLWVMVDEFQDTNELQCSILEGLGASRLLMVGDERQSIYRFRGADVEVFKRREAAAELQDGGTRVRRLDVNYRSRPQILSFVNRLFADESFFGHRFVPLEHGRDERTHDERPHDEHPRAEHGRAEHKSGEPALDGQGHYGRRRSAAASSGAERPPVAVEVLAVDRLERSGPDSPSPLMQEAEAQAVAASVRKLLDEEGWEPRDVVVLTPAQTHVDLYQQALLDRGVRVYVVGGKGYYSRDEIGDLAALLGLLVNPHDDLGLVTVLRSPIVGLSDDGLYLLGREARRKRARSLWEVIREGEISGMCPADRKVLREFVGRLGVLRHRVGRPGLARLIDDAVSDCGYDVCLLASEEGKRRFANVRKLMRIADDYEALQGPDLAGLVNALQSMGDLSDKEGSAPTLAEGENVVRIMTVHQAKGLEFPVVVLAGLGSDVPRGDRPRFVFSGDGRMGVSLKGSGHRTYEAGDLSWGPAAEIVAEEATKEREEDVRLLYVAMTRAEERLVLVGAKPAGRGSGGCRIGRMAMALGFDTLPEAGMVVPVEGLDAVVAGTSVSTPEISGSEGTEGTGTGGEQELPVPPDRDGVVGSLDACLQFPECESPAMAPRQISFSALALYLRCPRRFYLERMLGLQLDPVGTPAPTRTSLDPSGEDPDGRAEVAVAQDDLIDEIETRSGRTIGLIVHALLERHALEAQCPAPGALSGEIDDLTRQTAADIGLSEAERVRVLTLTRAFWRSPFASDRALAGAVSEAPFAFALGDTIVSGVMDLTWSVEGARHILDYKTNALDGRTPAEAAAGYDLQGAIYALAALRAGAEAVSMDFLFLERPDSPVRLSFDRGEEPRLESMVEGLLDKMRQGDFRMQPGEDCARCSVAPVCAGMVGSAGHGIE